MMKWLAYLSGGQKIALYLGLFLVTVLVLWALDFVTITYTFDPASFHFQMGGVGSTVVAIVTVVFWILAIPKMGD